MFHPSIVCVSHSFSGLSIADSAHLLGGLKTTISSQYGQKDIQQAAEHA